MVTRQIKGESMDFDGDQVRGDVAALVDTLESKNLLLVGSDLASPADFS